MDMLLAELSRRYPILDSVDERTKRAFASHFFGLYLNDDGTSRVPTEHQRATRAATIRVNKAYRTDESLDAEIDAAMSNYDSLSTDNPPS